MLDLHGSRPVCCSVWRKFNWSQENVVLWVLTGWLRSEFSAAPHVVLIGGGRPKYMAAKREWRQCCCQADWSLPGTRWPLRGSVVHCLIFLFIHCEESWAGGWIVFILVYWMAAQLNASEMCAQFVPICPVTSKRTDWASTTFPMLLIIYFFFSLVESVCKNRYKIVVWNVCHGCGLQVTASPHCGVLVAQLPKYLVYSLHHLPFTAPLTVQWSKNTLHSKLHTGKPQGIHPLCKFSWYRCSCFLLCFVWFLWVRGDKCMGTFLEYFCFALCF